MLEGIEMPSKKLELLDALSLFRFAAQRMLLQMCCTHGSIIALGILEPPVSSHSTVTSL